MRRNRLGVVLVFGLAALLTASWAWAGAHKAASEDELLQDALAPKAKAPAAPAKDEDLLSGVGGKAPKPVKTGMSLLLRDDLKDAFKSVMRSYFAEDETAFLAAFSDQLTMASRVRAKKSPNATKDDLRARVKKEFAQNNFTALKVEDAFDFQSPTMIFCLSEEQMHDKFPVWGFSQEPGDIVKFMKPGDYVVIANTRPQAAEKVPAIAFTYYLIFRKAGDKFVAVGLD